VRIADIYVLECVVSINSFTGVGLNLACEDLVELRKRGNISRKEHEKNVRSKTNSERNGGVHIRRVSPMGFSSVM